MSARHQSNFNLKDSSTYKPDKNRSRFLRQYFLAISLENVPLIKYQEVLAYPGLLSRLFQTDNVRHPFRPWLTPCLPDLVIPSMYTGRNHSNRFFVRIYCLTTKGKIPEKMHVKRNLKENIFRQSEKQLNSQFNSCCLFFFPEHSKYFAL